MFSIPSSLGEALRLLAAVWLVGSVLKISDEVIDQEVDRLAGIRTWAGGLGARILPYPLLFLALAVLIHPQVTLPLFLAGYGVGMLHRPGERLPLGLHAWLETLLAIGVSIWGYGLLVTALCWALLLVIQIWDDWADQGIDHLTGQPNLINRLGQLESFSLASACMAALILFAPGLLLASLICLPFIYCAWGERGVKDVG